MPDSTDKPPSSAIETIPGADRRLPRRLSPRMRTRVGYLVAQAHLAMHAAARDALSDIGLTVKHFACLSMIDEADAAGISQATLVEQSNIDRSTMVTIVDELEAAGYVVRSRNPEDRRAYALAITEDGRDWLAEAGGALNEMEDRQLAGLSPADRERLTALLQRMLEA